MSGEPLSARGHLALQTVLRASRDPVIDELRSTVATQAKELQELRGELAEAQDEVQKITQDCDGMREFLADVSDGLWWVQTESLSPEQKLAQQIVSNLRLRAEHWEDAYEEDASRQAEFERVMKAADRLFRLAPPSRLAPPRRWDGLRWAREAFVG
jgi:uncharacterized coiled-coil protein SlyX